MTVQVITAIRTDSQPNQTAETRNFATKSELSAARFIRLGFGISVLALVHKFQGIGLGIV
jgi:hypothetical protein